MDFFRIQDVAQFVAGETVETGEVGIRFGASLRMNNAQSQMFFISIEVAVIVQ
jgi:hypothetical protein